jgi:hypothetical protein
MKIIISESQYKLILEQRSDAAMDAQAKAINNLPNDYKHTLLTIFGIGTTFIPFVGPFIATAIGLADASLYYREGDEKTAGMVATFSMLPFVGSVVSKIPGVKELGTKGMALLANKLSMGGANLTKAELEITNAIKNYTPQIQSELTKMAPKLKGVMKEVNMFRGNFIKKYGEPEYNKLLSKYLYDGIDQKTFLNTLKNVKSPNIKIKPILGAGADHRVFQSSLNPNQIFKAELRPGEIDKWYDTFKKNPNLFAKTFKKVKVKDSDGTLLNAVVMEKLNTKPFIELWDTMEKTLRKMPNSIDVSLEYLSKHINEPSYRKVWNNFLNYSKKQEPTISNKIGEFSKMVDNLYKITPNPDIRKFNLGYDTSGLLKVLDI